LEWLPVRRFAGWRGTAASIIWERQMLRDIDENGGTREMLDIDYREQFEMIWNRFTPDEQRAIDNEIRRLIDALIENPDRTWGSIMNTSIEGGKANPFTGEPGDWTGTPWQPIWEHQGRSDAQAALFFGTLWKLRIIERPEQWIGIRTTLHDPTFPNRDINLSGKTYFMPNRGNGRL